MTSIEFELSKKKFLDQSDNEENKEAEEILDKRLVEGKEPWYLIKWKNSSQLVKHFCKNHG